MKKFIIPGLVVFVAALVGVVYVIIQTVPNKPFSKTKSSVASVKPSSTVKAVSRLPVAPQSADQDKVIKEIREELQTVMVLNKKINSVQQSKSAQMLRIQEQAQIHQKILSEIQLISGGQRPKLPSRETLLAQEKLRIIREETLRNKKLLQDSAQKPAS